MNAKPERRCLHEPLNLIKEQGKMDIDTLCFRSRMQPHKAAGILLNLEFNGVVRSLPGKVYAVN